MGTADTGPSNYHHGLPDCNLDWDICLLGPPGSFEVYYYGYGIAATAGRPYSNTICDKAILPNCYCRSADSPASNPA